MDYVKYLQIPYQHLGRDTSGVDCYGLVKLFYQQEFGIVLEDLIYNIDWYKEDPKYILNLYKKMGFIKTTDLIYGNILVLKEGSFIKHLGVVLEDTNYFLHTTAKGTCCSKLNQGYWHDKVACVLRYKGLKTNENKIQP